MLNQTRLFTAALVGFGFAASSHAAIITQWNFNSATPDANTATGTLTPSIGSGSVSLVGSTTSTFASGSPGDPANSGTDNSGLNVTTWPAQGTGSGTAGVRYNGATTGYKDIVLNFDLRMSGTVSRFFQLQVTTDGTTFSNVSGGTAAGPTTLNNNVSASITNGGLISVAAASGSQQFAQGFTYTFPSGSAVEDKANFGFRFVSVFDPVDGANYISSNAGTTAAYSVNGTFRNDVITINGTAIPPVPEPASLAVFAGAGAISLRRRRVTK